MTSKMKYPDMRWGTMEAVINKLGGIEGVQKFLSGASEVVIRKHLIDCSAIPFIPDGWSVEEHRRGKSLLFDAAKVRLHLDLAQKNGGRIVGHELRGKLKGKRVLNANVLDYLLKYPELIPEDWKGTLVFFWGTIYRVRRGGLCVRCLFWHCDRWCWLYGWLVNDWVGGYPAAVSAR